MKKAEQPTTNTQFLHIGFKSVLKLLAVPQHYTFNTSVCCGGQSVLMLTVAALDATC